MNSLQLDRPKRGHFYLGLYREIDTQTRKDDPQRQAVYDWESAVLGEERHPLVPAACTQAQARSTALAYLEHLWARYAPRFSPYFPGLPYLRVGSFKREFGPVMHRHSSRIAHASVKRHAIYVSVYGLRRDVLVHEVGHLLEWRDHHGPRFCGVLLHMYEGEFGVYRALALHRATQLGVAIDTTVLQTNALTRGTP